LFACPVCNGSAKVDQFPLERGSKSLRAPQNPPGRERPLLIDPAAENPLRHIRFRPYAVQQKTRWRPEPRRRSTRGRATIEVLKLDRPDLLELYDHHVEVYVLPPVNRLKTAIQTGDGPRVREIWDREVRGLIRAQRPFTALSYDAIEHEVPSGLRRQWGLRFQAPR
jgi:hypothetical protein